MIGRIMWNAAVPFVVLAALAGASRGQAPVAEWTLYSPTGDIAEIDVQGSVAWIAADGGVVRIDLATAGSSTPDQRKIGDREGLVSSDLTSLDFDSFGNVWVGTKEDGISVFNSNGSHLEDLSSFDTIRSDLVVDLRAFGNRMYVVSTDEYTPQGGLSGGGYVPVEVSQEGGTFKFQPVGLGVAVDLIQTVLPEQGETWIGTSGRGLWRKDETTADPAVLVVDQSGGLLSNNVKRLVRAPNPDQGGVNVLWLGTGNGLQTWDGAALSTIGFFQNRDILDVYVDGTTMLVLAQTASSDRDLYRMNLGGGPLAPARIPRADCFPDTLYVPRQVAVDGAGRICLGTQSYAFAVREGTSPFPWISPPPLGPHFPTVSDLAVAADGVLYFATDPGDALQGVGAGRFDGVSWTVISTDQGLVNRDIREVAVWPDTTVWFASAISAFTGGLNHYFPKTGAVLTYHDTVPNDAQRTQGKNCRSLELDRFGNLWVVVGQSQGNGGGISVIEAPPSLRITNFRVSEFSPGANELLRDLAFDSRDRIWISTFQDATRIGQLYVVDPRGTLATKSDDIYKTFNVANEIFDIGIIENIEIDSQDQIWLAGEKGLVVGQIGPDLAGGANAAWQLVTPGVDQTGGRNPLPYTVAKLDSDDSIWLGTEAAGVVNVTKDASKWTWYDKEAGEPLPDQSIKSLFIDKVARSVWIGTASAGIARLDLRARRSDSGDRIDPELFPNPWRPEQDGPLAFRAISSDEVVTLRIYTVAGELVYEGADLRGAKTWSGRNLGSQIVEGGTYLVMATASNGKIYEGKVAVLR